MTWMRWLTCLVVATFVGVPAWSEDWTPAGKLDAYFDSLASHQLANASVAISENGLIRYQRSVGFARLDGGISVPANESTRYRVGSVSKLYTAILVMQLAESRRISLDDAIDAQFPSLSNASSLTPRQMLRHQSGFPNYSDDPGFEGWRSQPRSHEAMLATIAAAGARFKPGERMEYSNSNYLVLGYLLEKARARDFPAILRQQIGDKLGLTQTYYMNSDANPLESASYSFAPEGWIPQAKTDPSIHGGAGSVISTPVEMVRLIDGLYAGRLVSPSSLLSMQRQEKGSGMGLWPYTVSHHTGFGHGGRIEGFRACVYHFPHRGISIAYATNASILSMDEIVDELLALVFEHSRRPPTFEEVTPSKRRFGAIAGKWRSAPGMPKDSPFRQFAAPDRPLELVLRDGAQNLTATLNGTDFRLVPLGEDEYLVDGIRYFLRAYPRSGELVVRGPEWSYYFRREKPAS